ncbi:sterile alpha motif domain-containing protein 3-like [Ixodes scapularis]
MILKSCSVKDIDKVLDKDFNEYVDILDEDKIHDMALLRVVKTAHGGETPSGEGSSVDENTPGTSQERHFKITPSHGDDDGAGFVLPDFDFLKAAAAGGKPLGSYVTTRIVDVLFQEMATHTLYPSRAFYQNVGRALVSQYPQLADTCGSGHDSWVMFIRQKFKNERRKLSTDRVMSSREKYGSTAKKPRTSSGTTTEELQRGSIGQTLAQSSTPCGEDASSLAQHEAWLCQEWKKPNPDNQQMRCRLELTHQARVEQLSRLSVAVAVTKYPYLRDADLTSGLYEPCNSWRNLFINQEQRKQCLCLWTPVYEKRGPKWCIASPGGPRRVQTYPGLGSTTRMPFSPDTGSPRTARRGWVLATFCSGSVVSPMWLGSVVTLLTKHLAPKVQAPPAGLEVRGDATLQTPAFTGAPCGDTAKVMSAKFSRNPKTVLCNE